MLRSAVSKVMWVGRATVFMVGLAVIVGLVLGLASMALGADADFFKIGRLNEAASTSTLDKSGSGPALSLQVDKGPPLAVNKQARVANLNADKLDGLDSRAFDTSNTGKIHRIDSATRLDGGEISLITIGPYELVGECHNSSGTPIIQTWVNIAAGGRPSYGGVISTTASERFTWENENQVTSQTLMLSSGADATAYVTGFVYTPTSPEPSFTFQLYQNRNTHPTVGALCTFGGYVVEDV